MGGDEDRPERVTDARAAAPPPRDVDVVGHVEHPGARGAGRRTRVRRARSAASPGPAAAAPRPTRRAGRGSPARRRTRRAWRTGRTRRTRRATGSSGRVASVPPAQPVATTRQAADHERAGADAHPVGGTRRERRHRSPTPEAPSATRSAAPRAPTAGSRPRSPAAVDAGEGGHPALDQPRRPGVDARGPDAAVGRQVDGVGDDVHRAVARVAVGVDHRERAGLQGHVERTEDGVGAVRARRQQRHLDRALRHVGVGELAVGDVGEHRLAVDLDVGGRDGRGVGEQDAGLAGTDRPGRVRRRSGRPGRPRRPPAGAARRRWCRRRRRRGSTPP